MKKSFSMWRAGLAAAFAMVWLVAEAGAEPFVVGWGMNANGQAVPTPVGALSGATFIAAGYHHSLAVVDSCTYAWGLDDQGQCTVPSAGRTNVVAVAAGEGFSLALHQDGTVVGWGRSDVVGSLTLPDEYKTNVAQIAAGEAHVVILKKDGSVRAAGVDSTAPECKVPESLSNVVQVAAGSHFSLARKTDGSIVAWGDLDQAGGVLAIPPTLTQAKSIAAGHYHALAINEAGNLIEWGWIEGHVIPTAVKTGAIAIAAGYDFSMAIASDGKVYVWGDDSEGQLSSMPESVKNSASSQIAAGFGHCLVLGAGMAPYWLGDSVPGDAYVARAYSGSVSATGMPEVVYGKAGVWPSWLKIDSRTGVLSGTPTATSRVEHVSVVASNIYGVESRTFDIQVFDTPVDPPEFITKNIPAGEVGLPYSFRIQASNSPLFHAIDTDSYPLPAGLELAEDGTLSGTPTAEYDSIFYVMASNVTAAVTTNYLMHVGAPSEAPTILTGNPLPDAMLGDPWSVQIETDREATFAIVSGQCPAGVDIEPATGVISGTPSESGAFAFTVQAANSAGVTNAAYDLAVNAVPAITTETLPGGNAGANYSQTIGATGWPVPTFALASGTLPAGLALDAAGTLSGKLTAAGTYAFSVVASNTVGTDTRSYTVVVNSIARPEFTSMSFTTNKVTLTWTNGTTNTYLYWSTNISSASPTWKSLGKKKSGVTIAQTNSTPIYYRLRIP